jgi:ribonuclease HI
VIKVIKIFKLAKIQPAFRQRALKRLEPDSRIRLEKNFNKELNIEELAVMHKNEVLGMVPRYIAKPIITLMDYRVKLYTNIIQIIPGVKTNLIIEVNTKTSSYEVNSSNPQAKLACVKKGISYDSIWTDGSSLWSQGPSGIGCVIVRGDRKGRRELHFSKFIGTATSHKAELLAILVALHKLKPKPGKRFVRIYTDSTNVINVITGKGKANKCKEIVKEIQTTLNKFKGYQFYPVKGHGNNYYNIIADKLAREAANGTETY